MNRLVNGYSIEKRSSIVFYEFIEINNLLIRKISEVLTFSLPHGRGSE